MMYIDKQVYREFYSISCYCNNFCLIEIFRTTMDGVIKDLKKIEEKGMLLAKKLIYYGYIPLILYIGGRTVDWSAIFPKA
jgi:hypothetical protein